jgi:peptidoglycan hydrolase-like protein with peptidoglycan-binding domain
MADKHTVLYILDNAVGFRLANKPLDVFLVQFMLGEVFRAPYYATRKPDEEIVLDGVFGSQTHRWIETFQRSFNALGQGQLWVDGRVHPSNQSYFKNYRTAGGRVFTILAINTQFRKHFMRDHDYLDRHPRCPGPLRAALRDPASKV